MNKNPVEAEMISALWKRYKKAPRKDLRNKLVEHYMPIVKTIAERLSLHLPGFVGTDDLISLGISGLFNAIKLFNLSRGVRFETYCVTRIRGSMIDGLRDADWVPRLVRMKSHRLEKSHRQLQKKLCRKPSDMEIARDLKVPIDEYNKLVRESMPTSMMSFAYKDNNDDANVSTANMFEDAKSEDDYKTMLNKQLIEYIKSGLVKKERLVLEMYYYEELTMAEIGRVLGITESRVSQILANLIKRLKSLLRQHKYEWMSA
ncbi:MAG: FliA/WhiG family RNA polymerase sigma factor [Planctomycetes bacterium]|nr:FliA/WhiG family RNA polymerase sigma factor [Planctomycetota bacterium]